MNCDELIQILRAHDASFDTHVVKAAFEDESSPLAEWARQHVTHDTFLSVDELQQ
jgi:hypothetical protein